MNKTLRKILLFGLICIISTLTTLSFPMVSANSTQKSRRLISGITYHDGSFMNDYSEWVGHAPAVVNVFTDSDESHARDIFTTLYKIPTDVTPMVTLQLWMGGKANTPLNISEKISNGEHDDFFKGWAQELKVFLAGEDGKFGTSDDRKIFLRLGHEMNGAWYAWHTSPEYFKKAWQRIYHIFSEVGINDRNHIQWLFSVNNIDIGKDHKPIKMEKYYPGDQFVDWTGVDGYNKGDRGRRSPEQVFGDMVERLKKLAPTKPLSINEIGTISFRDTEWKDKWIEGAYKYFSDHCIQMVVWFNYGDEKHDNQVFAAGGGDEIILSTSGKENFGYSAYRKVMNRAKIIHAPLSNYYFRGGK